MRAVNLLPRETRSSRSVTAQNLPAVVGGAVGLVVVAALAAGYLNASSKVAAAQRSLDDAQAQLAATPLPPAPPPASPTPTAAVAQQAPRLQALSTILSQRIEWDRVLREFSLVLPTDVWITSLGMTSGSGGFSIQATTYSYDSVARMLARMALVPDLTNVSLGSLSSAGRLVTFSIKADVKGGVPSTTSTAVAPPTTTTTTTTTTPTTTTTDSGSTS